MPTNFPLYPPLTSDMPPELVLKIACEMLDNPWKIKEEDRLAHAKSVLGDSAPDDISGIIDDDRLYDPNLYLTTGDSYAVISDWDYRRALERHHQQPTGSEVIIDKMFVCINPSHYPGSAHIRYNMRKLASILIGRLIQFAIAHPHSTDAYHGEYGTITGRFAQQIQNIIMNEEIGDGRDDEWAVNSSAHTLFETERVRNIVSFVNRLFSVIPKYTKQEKDTVYLICNMLMNGDVSRETNVDATDLYSYVREGYDYNYDDDDEYGDIHKSYRGLSRKTIKLLYTTIVRCPSAANLYWVLTDVITVGLVLHGPNRAMYYGLLVEVLVNNAEISHVDLDTFIDTTYRRDVLCKVSHTPAFIHYQKLELTDAEVSAFNIAEDFTLNPISVPMVANMTSRKAILKSLLKSRLERQVGSIGTYPLSRRYIESNQQLDEDPEHPYGIHDVY